MVYVNVRLQVQKIGVEYVIIKNMTEIYKIIAVNLKSIRTKLKLSQENLAELVGLDRKTINAIESGNKSIKLDTLMKICNKLKISPIELFYTENQASDNDKLILCVSLLNNLNNEKLDYALKFLNSIK